MPITLAARRFITAHAVIEHPLITIDGPTITAIGTREAKEQPATGELLDLHDAVLTPGLFDIHMHGAVGHDVMEGTTETLRLVSRFLASRGVTEYLATTVTASMEGTLRALDGIGRHIEKGPEDEEAAIAGIHIEGPFVSHIKRGMHPEHFIVPPSPELLNRFWEASRGTLKLMTIAPELDGARETIARGTQLGIRSSIGHSNATQGQAQSALEAGATSATHTFNAMRPLDHREPGILGFVLDRDDLFADLICDGVHVAPEMVRLWFKAKGPDRAILITDALEAAGMPNGTYKLGETAVYVKDGRCTTEAGVLAGSIITLDQAVARFRQYTGADLPTAVRLASRNPAHMLGIAVPGAVGSPADFNVYNESGERMGTMVRGRSLPGALG